MKSLRIYLPGGVLRGNIQLPTSKSISNRLLILKALSEHSFNIDGLSSAKDTQLLRQILEEENDVWNVGDAGTAMRFLTAYACAKAKKVEIYGSERMHQRPIGPLVDALHNLGFKIEYLDKSGYPPLRILKSEPEEIRNSVELDASVSSQYVTALKLIAPFLKHGLKIKLTGNIVSASYIHMTGKILEDMGVSVSWKDKLITIEAGFNAPAEYLIEADWSSAGYWLAMSLLANSSELRLEGLFEESYQGDQQLLKILSPYYLECINLDNALSLSTLKPLNSSDLPAEMDFTDIPDQVQTLAVFYALNSRELILNGVHNLQLKETRRMDALREELLKLNAKLEQINPSSFRLTPGELPERIAAINTYGDHRMAMAFTMTGARKPVIINDPDVVVKSYPSFWEDIERMGFELKYMS